ncbi:MAG: AAA family ATPase [Candidatus Binatus sp.]|uniref:AAA family ATPase n=1 Tax=Candidatus Binatus sp. TaxID=2811406 RepID=UPI003CB8CD5C
MPFNGSKSEGRRSTMKVMLVGEPGEQRTQLKTVLAALIEPELEIIEGETATAANLSENAAAPPAATLVIVNGNEEAALGFLQNQVLHSPRPSLLAVLTARSAGLMKRALRAGADEILFMPLDPGEATRALLKISEARWRTERREGGVVISVTSLIGGVGVTSLAGNLALALATLHQRVALVDLDLQTGGLAVFLNLDPEVTIMPLVRLDRKLDSIQLESALTKHQSGVYLLAAPKRIEEGELVSDITVGTVLDLIRQLFDYVIVDCGDHVDENGVAAWERSEHLFYVLNQTIAAARSAWRFIDLFERLDLTTLEPHFILNRYNPSHPLTEKAIEATLARPIYAKIPTDDRTFESIEMKAQDLFQLAPSSPVARAMLELAALVMPRPELVPLQETFMSRLKSAFVTHQSR